MSQHGKLPGFRTLDQTTCEAGVHGTIYDRVMTIRLIPDDAGTRLETTTRLKRTMPVVVLVVMVLATFPGVLLTHSMLETYFGWYPRALWITCAWYLPLMLLAIPALLAQYRASQRAAAEHEREVLERILEAVEAAPRNTGGTPVPPSPPVSE